MVEEAAIASDAIRIERRFRVRADGVAAYGTATEAVVDPQSGTALPVFDRLAVYELVPTCTRALARRVHLAGVLALDPQQGQREGEVTVGALLRWRALDQRKTVSSRGRVHGAMAEILAIVGAHFPAGEALATPGVAERGIAPVLRGVPEPAADGAGALQVHLDLSAARPKDAELLLDAFALACKLGRRELAMQLLRRWREQLERSAAAGEAAAGALTPEILARMLPPAGG